MDIEPKEPAEEEKHKCEGGGNGSPEGEGSKKKTKEEIEEERQKKKLAAKELAVLKADIRMFDYLSWVTCRVLTTLQIANKLKYLA